jgi:hypothetical protein
MRTTTNAAAANSHIAGQVTRNLVMLGVMLGFCAWTSSAQAMPANWGYLWADQPIAASYTPIHQDNSSGAVNTVTRTGVGVYMALLPNLGASAGVVHVTAVGNFTQHCKVNNWGPPAFSTTQQVAVRCFNQSGALADSQFTLSYVNPVVSDGPMAYLWADQPSAATYVPYAAYQFNSSGSTNTVTRTGVGAYKAVLPNVGGNWEGHVQVTAYGSGTERCKVSNWRGAGTVGRTLATWSPLVSGVEVNVRCFAGSGVLPGTPADTKFTLTFVAWNSLIGSIFPFGANGYMGTYLWADNPTSASYTPSLTYQWSDSLYSPQVATVNRSGIGAYSVQFGATGLERTHVQVTAYGTGSEHCKLAGWDYSSIEVRCFDSAGHSVDTRFTLAFVGYWSGF